MHPTRALQLCALPMALTLLLGPARAQAPEHSTDEAPLELPADAPLDLSTPEPDSGKLKGMTPFADRASALDWNGKAGIDYSKPSVPGNLVSHSGRPATAVACVRPPNGAAAALFPPSALGERRHRSLARRLVAASGPIWSRSGSPRFAFSFRAAFPWHG